MGEGFLVPGASFGAIPNFPRSTEMASIEFNGPFPAPNVPAFSKISRSTQFQPIVEPGHHVGTTSNPLDTLVSLQWWNRTSPTSGTYNASSSREDLGSFWTDDRPAIAELPNNVFLEEVDCGRFPGSLLPLSPKSGIDNTCSSVIGGFTHSPFDRVHVLTEMVLATFTRFFGSGKLSFETDLFIRFSPDGLDRFRKGMYLLSCCFDGEPTRRRLGELRKPPHSFSASCDLP